MMATGSIVTSLGEENNTGPADSIDVVFTTYWQYPAKVRIILPEDKACIEDFRKRHNITGKLTTSSSSNNDGDGYKKSHFKCEFALLQTFSHLCHLVQFEMLANVTGIELLKSVS